MKTPADECPDGTDFSELFALVEGARPESEATRVLEHMERCSVCSAEYEALSLMHTLLTERPEAFHPRPIDLAAYVKDGTDPGGAIGDHLNTCSSCRQDVEIVRAVFDAAGLDKIIEPQMPPNLRAALELRRPHTGLGRFTGGWFERLMDLLGFPFRVPVFALATAAAVVVVVLLLIPMTDTFRRQPMITMDERPAKAKQQPERPTRPDALLSKDAASTAAKSDSASPASMQESDEKAKRREPGPSGHGKNAVSERRRSSEQGAFRDRPLAAPPRPAEVEAQPPGAVAGALGSSDGDAGPKTAPRQA
ncbi:MAG: hypothetical protein V2B18_19065, partial [Pseudomonadota bacterium]